MFPLLTEAYGYYQSIQLTEEWDDQAKSQKAGAEKIRKEQERLVAEGQLPDEESILGDAAKAIAKKHGRKLTPFPKTKVIIPKIGVNQVINEGSSPAVLKHGPGHYVGMANPGEKGNCGVAGHRVTYTHPFNRLDELSKGDPIILETVDYVYEYRVESMVVVDPKNVSTLRPMDEPVVTLTTCNPKYSARTRLNVRGVLVDTRPQRASIIRVVRQIFKDKDKDTEAVKRAKTYAEMVKQYKLAKVTAERKPLDIASYIYLARACLALDLYAEAIDALKLGELLDPRAAEIRELHLVIAERRTQLEAKIASDERRTSDMRMLSPIPYIELGNMYMDLKDYPAALGAYDKAIQVSPHVSDVYVYKGLAYEMMGRLDLALATFNQSLTYDPTFKEALVAIERVKQKQSGGVAPAANDNRHYLYRPQ